MYIIYIFVFFSVALANGQNQINLIPHIQDDHQT